MTDFYDRSGNGGRSDPAFTDDRSGRSASPLVMATATEQAFNDRRVFTISSGIGNVAPGNSMVLLLTNPVDSGKLIIIRERLFTGAKASDLSGVYPPFFGTANPTGALPTSAMNPAGRNKGTSVLQAKANVMNTVPTGGSNPVGNFKDRPLGENFSRGIPPGESFAQYMTNTTNGLGNFDIGMCITISYEEVPYVA